MDILGVGRECSGGVDINPYEWAKCYTIFGLDLNGDLCKYLDISDLF